MTEISELNWNSISDVEKEAYLKAHEPDCSFLVGRDADAAKTFACHKLILSSVSDVFERMFNGNFKEATSCHDIPLTDVEELQDFQKFLDYVYYKDSDAFEYHSIETLITLLYLGKKYSIESLEKLCDKKIQERKFFKPLHITDMLSLFSFDYVKGVKFVGSCSHSESTYYQQQLAERAAELKDVNQVYCLETPVFSVLLKFLSQHETCPAICVFNLIEKYALLNGLDMDSSSCILKQWFRYVRFFGMSLAEFGNGPMCSKILNWSLEKKHYMLVEICKRRGHFTAATDDKPFKKNSNERNIERNPTSPYYRRRSNFHY